ncbi:MAG: sigma-54 dependent transcriptional regulator [Verrucomicrobiia bacterium]
MERVLLLQASAGTQQLLDSLFQKDAVQWIIQAQANLATLERQRPDLVLLELGSDSISGLKQLQLLRKARMQLPIIIISSDRNPELTMEVMKCGAYDILHTPLDREQANFLIRDALNTVRNIKSLKTGAETGASFFSEDMVGATPEMQAIFKLIGQIAPSHATVLITGESGVGKELIARAIYRHSLRKGQPYMAVNCAAIPDTLLESELFGHEKGAFTGATQTRQGKFEYCDEGTLFLDEVGDLSANTQAKLLRVLQNGEITRIGSNVPIHVNVRMIAATNRDLEKEVAEKRFREDLFYRLNVVRLEVPPLRERKKDIVAMSLAILKKIAARENMVPPSISEEAMQLLENYSWPGNIRELENSLHRAAVLTPGETIFPHHLPKTILGAELFLKTERMPMEKVQDSEQNQLFQELIVEAQQQAPSDILGWVEREMIRRIFQKTGENQLQTAKQLGISRITLRKRLVDLGLI